MGLLAPTVALRPTASPADLSLGLGLDLSILGVEDPFTSDSWVIRGDRRKGEKGVGSVGWL